MFKFNVPEKQYVLSLDKLDLSLLSQYMHNQTDEKRVLWSKPLMDGESVYCEVKISTEDDNEDPYIEPSESYMCHICNIDVPQQYSKQHVVSKQHQSYKLLSEKVLENVSKQTYINIQYVDDDETSNTFYCEICSKVVLRKHKQKHNRSQYHIKCINNQKLTENFLEIYVKNKEMQNENKYFNDNTKEEDENESELDCSDSDSNTDWNLDSESEDDETKQYNEAIQINKEFECSDATRINTIVASKEINNFQIYLKEITSKYQLEFNLPLVRDNSVVIVTPNGLTERISINAFHSYKKNNNSEYCQLCKVRVGQDTRYHSRTERHVKNIMLPINNDFAREIIGNVAWSHCLICNDLVKSGADHVSSAHKNFYEVNKSKCSINSVINNRYTHETSFCDVCNINIGTFDFSNHLNEKSHISKLTVTYKPSLIATKNSITLPKNTSSEKAPCGLSNIRGKIHEVVKSDNNIGNNLNSTIIQSKITELNRLSLAENKATTKSNSLTKPNTSTAQTKLVDDLTTKEEPIKNEERVSFDETAVLCLVCDLNDPFSDKDVAKHIEDPSHKKAINALLFKHRIQKKPYHLYHCIICNINCDDIITHITKDVSHKFNRVVFRHFGDLY